MQIFISIPMEDKDIWDIISERKKIFEEIKQDGDELVNQIIPFSDSFETFVDPNSNGLYNLGHSIRMMAFADVVYFAEGWENSRGCKIEHMCAEEFCKVIVEHVKVGVN